MSFNLFPDLEPVTSFGAELDQKIAGVVGEELEGGVGRPEAAEKGRCVGAQPSSHTAY